MIPLAVTLCLRGTGLEGKNQLGVVVLIESSKSMREQKKAIVKEHCYDRKTVD